MAFLTETANQKSYRDAHKVSVRDAYQRVRSSSEDEKSSYDNEGETKWLKMHDAPVNTIASVCSSANE